MEIHFVFDILASLAAAFVFRYGQRTAKMERPLHSDTGYWLAMLNGVILGAVFFGSLNLSWEGILRFGHSIAGALAGGIVAVEIYKLARGERRSTGAVFVLPLMAGIAIGRVGCFFAGLKDETYGLPASLPWGVDLGDGIARHPVQLYESLAMVLGGALIYRLRRHDETRFNREGFYVFILFYATQRFAWEFLKPYPRIFFHLNLFHIICMALIIYSLSMMRFNRARNA
jgi:prolipoprotein diacylglyceryltransferase